MRIQKIVNEKIEIKARIDLNEKKLNHSKVKNLKHNNFGIQKYYKQGKTQKSVEDK